MKFKELLTNQNEDAISKQVDEMYQASFTALRKHHRNWYLIDRFIDGEHWSIYNKTTGTIQTLPTSRGEIRRTINLIDSQLRAVKNFVTRNDIRSEIYPSSRNNEDKEEKAKQGQKIAQYYFDKTQIRRIQGDLVDEGLRHGIAFLYTSLGDTDNDGVPEIHIDVKSSYDIYPAPGSKSLDVADCKYIIVISKQYIDELETDPSYEFTGEIAPGSSEHPSEYKAKLDRDRNDKEPQQTEGLQQIYVKDVYFRYKEEKSEQWKIGVVSVANEKIIRKKPLNVNNYPVIPYWPERKVDQLYPKAWAKNLISPNKSVDKMASHIESYVLQMLSGKWLVKEGSTVRKITDAQGEVVRWTGTRAPEQVGLQALPSTPFNYIEFLLRMIQDLGGMHPSSLGALSSTTQSGKSIEALQAADANNVADPIKNLSYTLTELTKRMFNLLSSHTLIVATLKQIDGKPVKFIGQGPLKESPEVIENYEKQGTLVLGDTDIKVESVPGIAYTEAGKYEKLLELVQAKVLPVEILLDQLKFSNISDIMAKLEKQQRMEKQEGQPSTNPIELANMENMSMIQGQQVPPTPVELVIPEHTELHRVFLEDQKAKGTPEEQLQLIIQHYNQEKTYG